MTGPKNPSTLRLRLKSRTYGKEVGTYYGQLSHVLCCKLEHFILLSSLPQGFLQPILI